MSTLNVSNISDGTDTVATGYVVNGSAKAWATLTGTGTATLDDSINVTSITDSGTGDYTTTYTSAFNSATKSVVSSGGYWGCNVEIEIGYSASANRFLCKDIGSSAARRDADVLNTTAFGDLA